MEEVLLANRGISIFFGGIYKIMTNNTLETRILICNDTAVNWGESSKVLLKGEMAIEFLESRCVKIKVGNGTDTFADLPYATMTPSEITTAINNAITAASHTHSNKSTLDKIQEALTTALKTNYDAAYTHSTQTHAPANAQANIIETVKVNGSALTPNSKAVDITVPTKVSQLTNDAGYKTTDNNTTYDLGANASATNGNVKLNLIGSNSTADSVTIKGSGATTVTTDADGNITINSTNTVYSHPNSGATAGTYRSVTVNAQGHVTGGSNPTTLTGYGITDAVKSSEKGSANGVATLGSDGKVPSSQLPSYVDDVIEGYLSGGKFYKESAHTTVISGETGKIYVDLTSNKTYRWSGSAFVVISETIAIGETSSTAYRGDRGKIAYDHSQSAHAPSNAEANQNAFSNVTVGSTTIAAGTKTDILNIAAGSNVTITPDTTNKKITIAAKDTTYGVATTGTSGLMSAADKTKLDGIADGANKYVHPTSSGNKHIPAGGSAGQILRWSSDGTAVWGADNNTTYSDMKGATTDAAGTHGLVPAPSAGQQGQFLRGDGTWSTPTDTITKVKGNAENTYRGGNVNITPANIGLGNVNNTADTVKNVLSATKFTTARTISLGTAVTAAATSFDGSQNIVIPITALNMMYARVNSGDTLILNGGGAI